MKPCVFCLNLTYETCLECGEPFCCSVHESLLCPMCVRIKAFKAEQAARGRVVYWQYVDVPIHVVPIRPQFRGNPLAETIPMETIKVENV